MISYAHESSQALADIEIEGQRGIDWITVDRAAFWKAEMRRAADGVNQAIKDLEHCRTYKKVGDNTPACAEEKKNLEKVINILKSNKIVSLIADAGTPTISDPGNILIKECIKNEINVSPIPGPSATTAAFSISGFSDKYYFYGFFPENNSEIKKNFELLSKLDSSIIFFISAKKFNRSIHIIKKYFSDRELLICKEITKYYEEYFRFKINKLNPKNINLKGEITLVISSKNNSNKSSNNLTESDKKKINKLIKKFNVKEIVDLIKDGKDISKKEIYSYCLKVKNEK